MAACSAAKPRWRATYIAQDDVAAASRVVAQINTNRLNQIGTALGLFQKPGQDHFTAAKLNAWAAEAEESFDNGNGMCIEIKRWDSTTGRTEVVTIAAGGYDIETLDDE